MYVGSVGRLSSSVVDLCNMHGWSTLGLFEQCNWDSFWRKYCTWFGQKVFQWWWHSNNRNGHFWWTFPSEYFYFNAFITHFKSENRAIYRIYGYLATASFDKIDEVLARQLSQHGATPAHVSRFYAHLVLLLKFMGKELSASTVDRVICQFVDVLISLSQFVLAPYYLSQVSEEVRKEKMIFLLRSKRSLWTLSYFKHF